MLHQNASDLLAFLAVARERSFAQAAASIAAGQLIDVLEDWLPRLAREFAAGSRYRQHSLFH